LAKQGQVLKIPIAHNEGNYHCDGATVAGLQKNRQILFRYTSVDGSNDDSGNPNGSMSNIAGICNRERNVAGLMPHPERAVESALDSADGLVIFQSMVAGLVGAAKATA
jgi:phosphoribosylformylglycinamidine synthase